MTFPPPGPARVSSPVTDGARVGLPSVYLLIHDDRWYEEGDSYVRGVYADEWTATAALVTRTPSGRLSKAWGAHTESCCSVVEHEVLGEPAVDIQDDPPPPDPNAVGIIPDSVREVWEKALAEPNLYRTILKLSNE